MRYNTNPTLVRQERFDENIYPTSFYGLGFKGEHNFVDGEDLHDLGFERACMTQPDQDRCGCNLIFLEKFYLLNESFNS